MSADQQIARTAKIAEIENQPLKHRVNEEWRSPESRVIAAVAVIGWISAILGNPRISWTISDPHQSAFIRGKLLFVRSRAMSAIPAMTAIFSGFYRLFTLRFFWRFLLLAQQRKQDHVSDGARIGQQHGEPVNANAFATRWRQAV